LHAEEEIEVQYVESHATERVLERAAANGDILDSSALLCGPWLLSRLDSLRAASCAATSP
jgi:hypothetical protein